MVGSSSLLSPTTHNFIPAMPGFSASRPEIGALCAFDFTPSAIVPSYGDNPRGFMVFVRLATP